MGMKTEQCEDYISRETAIKLEELEKRIEALEQEPKPKIGRWINHYGWYECDRCHTERVFYTRFCPDCGAKMVEPQESEE